MIGIILYNIKDICLHEMNAENSKHKESVGILISKSDCVLQ
jgi:hypothetical protein